MNQIIRGLILFLVGNFGKSLAIIFVVAIVIAGISSGNGLGLLIVVALLLGVIAGISGQK